MPTNSELAVFEASARALTHGDGLASILDVVLETLTRELEIASAAVFTAGNGSSDLTLAAWTGFADPEGLSAAVRRPGHPIAQTVVDGIASFDVKPTAPGGPALRSHLPLTVSSDGRDVVLGVLAIAHDAPTDPDRRRLLAAIVDLIAVAIERDRANG